MTKVKVEVDEIANRLRKSLRPGDRPSLLMTNLAVEYFTQAVPPGLGQVDMNFAASLTKKRRISPCTLMLAFVYVDRLRNYNPDYLHKISSSDLFLVSMIVASKFLNDEGEEDEIFNDHWASFAHMKTKEVNKLEREFLAALDWQVFVSAQTLNHILNRTESVLAYKEGRKRGWFTYSDLEILCRCFPNADVILFGINRIFKVVAICSLIYTTGIITIIASTSIVLRVINPLVLSALQTRVVTVHPNNNTSSGFMPRLENNIDLCPVQVVQTNCSLPETIQPASNPVVYSNEKNCSVTKNLIQPNLKMNIHKISFFVIENTRWGRKNLFETRSSGGKEAVVDR